MSVQRVLQVGFFSGLVAAALVAGTTPVAVSPGTATGALIGDGCPTFSWGEVNGATSYELVIYRIGEGGGEAEPVLRQSFAGSVASWTPSLDRCVERGNRYAWSVRAAKGKRAGDWSPPSLFQVATGPSEVDFEEALAVVQRYLTHRGEAVAEMKATPESQAAPEPETIRKDVAASPGPRVPPPIDVTVEGWVEAASFIGNGSMLTGVNADLLDGMDSTAFGDVHGVFAGAGLAGGGSAGNVILSVAPDGVTATHLAANSVGRSEIADYSVGAYEIGFGAVHGNHLGGFGAVSVECNGECGDGDLWEICGEQFRYSAPLFVFCRGIRDSSEGTSCGGDNLCFKHRPWGPGSLGEVCQDVSGLDALVGCLIGFRPH